MQTADVIVLGLGGMGSSACFHLAKQGLSTIGIEQFPLVHSNGSSHGSTRVIRKAYFEKPDYIPLLKDAYRFWRDLETASGHSLFVQNGVAMFLDTSSELRREVVQNSKQHSIEITEISLDDVAKKWPTFRPHTDAPVLFEPEAGYLLVENCVETYLEEAKKLGATLFQETVVQSWKKEKGLFRVETSQGNFESKSLIITAGAWANSLLPELKLPLTVHRNLLFWFQPKKEGIQLPTWFTEYDKRFVYGFPPLPNQGMKVAEHSPGEKIDPGSVDRTVGSGESKFLEKVLDDFLPGFEKTPSKGAVCLYTMTPDEDFIIDQHPEHESLFYAAGFSGHGFKFASAVGKELADRVAQNSISEKWRFLMNRF